MPVEPKPSMSASMKKLASACTAARVSSQSVLSATKPAGAEQASWVTSALP